jgi:hypothetical protein
MSPAVASEITTSGIRRCNPADHPWLVALALRSYGDRIKSRRGLETWVASLFQSPDIFVACTDGAAIIAFSQARFFDPAPELRLLYLASETGTPWDALELLRGAMAWGKERGAEEFFIRSGTDIDLGPLARRLGKTRAVPCYIVEIR